MSEQAPAGWYPDGVGGEWYWDGLAWTTAHRVLTEPAAGATSVERQPGGFAQVGSAIKNAASNRQAAKDELSRQHTEVVDAAGALVTSGVFGSSTIEIYAGGYVRVAEGQPEPSRGTRTAAKVTKKTPYARLHSIKFTAATDGNQSSAFDSSSLVKGASALIKGGSSVLKASAPGLAVAGLSQVAKAKLGKTFLTIATDKGIHLLTNETHNGWMKVVNKGHNEVGLALEEAGHLVLGTSTAEQHEALGQAMAAQFVTAFDGYQSARPMTDGPTVSQRLRELAELHRDGIISDEEFSAAKVKLLDL